MWWWLRCGGAVEFWNAVVNWNTVDKGRFEELRGVFVQVLTTENPKSLDPHPKPHTLNPKLKTQNTAPFSRPQARGLRRCGTPRPYPPTPYPRPTPPRTPQTVSRNARNSSPNTLHTPPHTHTQHMKLKDLLDFMLRRVERKDEESIYFLTLLFDAEEFTLRFIRDSTLVDVCTHSSS